MLYADRASNDDFHERLDVALHLAHADRFSHSHQVSGGEAFDEGLCIRASMWQSSEERPRGLVRRHAVRFLETDLTDALLIHVGLG
jgi:hypothetical protein